MNYEMCQFKLVAVTVTVALMRKVTCGKLDFIKSESGCLQFKVNFIKHVIKLQVIVSSPGHQNNSYTISSIQLS